MTTMKATPTRHIERTGSVCVRGGNGPVRALSRGIEAAALVAIAILLVVGAMSSGTDVTDPTEVTRIQAEPGDTLWSIARAHPVDGLTTEQTVALIVSLNGLDSPSVATGGSLDVPQAAIDMAVASK